MAIDVLEQVLHYFEGFGPIGLLAFLFAVFFLDAMLVPTLPELFVMAFFASNPSLGWGVTLLAVVCAAEVASNYFLYAIVKRRGLPRFFQKKMKKWIAFLIVSDERLILVNRVVPVVPIMGAFIALMNWDLRKSLLFVLVGGAVKYAILMAFVTVAFGLFEGPTARNATLVLILVVVGVSMLQSYRARHKHLGPVASAVAHLGEPSSGAVAAAADAKDHKDDSGPKDGQEK